MWKSDYNLQKYEDEVPAAFTPHVYEVHGNSFYMHCSDEQSEHSKKFFACPKLMEVKNK